MMVTFVSQCQKGAIKRTRRVLDAFADRIGDNVWQTVISEDGLKTVKRILRKTASKSTAVGCHWIRSRSRTEFLWSIGRKDLFNNEGRVPVNTTEKQLNPIESHWNMLPAIKALVAIAGLFHDWGKANVHFQNKLKSSNGKPMADPLRHEWVSCQLLRAFIGDAQTDDEWLDRLAAGDFSEYDSYNELSKIDKPLKDAPPVAGIVLWLILTHHRLPTASSQDELDKFKGDDEGLPNRDELFSYDISTNVFCYSNPHSESAPEECWLFQEPLLTSQSKWNRWSKKWAGRLQNALPLLNKSFEDGTWRIILHFSRLSLMLGDYAYSSQEADSNWNSQTNLFANTERRNNKKTVLKQKLDEHLVGVSQKALAVAHRLSEFEQKMPAVDGLRSLRRKSDKPQFKWQDKAANAISQWKSQEKRQSPFGFFIVNMASTGCGKTFANAKMMRALSDDGDSLRYILALGLRTLTLQTGDEYRERVGLDNSELAVLIGSTAVRELHETKEADNKEYSGSDSDESLFDNELDYDCDIQEQHISTILQREKDRHLLYAPVLACTIDHLMSATETRRGGRYILPVLRLMSSDLVIDEIDDFSGDDLTAIGRLVHLAGMLGRKVMISSATIPPSLAEGFFHAYQEGWRIFAQSRECRQSIGCAWVDEFGAKVESVAVPATERTAGSFHAQHQRFVNKRCEKIKKAHHGNRIARIVQLPDATAEIYEATVLDNYHSTIQQQCIALHDRHHTIDSVTNKNVSFGVIRTANINPCVEIAQFLANRSWPSGYAIKVMAYHSRQVLLLRHSQESHLDDVLKRKDAHAVFKNKVIRAHLDSSSSKNVVFILVATPVEEVGRDHDFDWAIIEPSSFRSIIQLAGRVLRHRRKKMIDAPNIAILNYNRKGYLQARSDGDKSEPVFCRPGFESRDSGGSFGLEHHDMVHLLNWQNDESQVNAIPRITASANLEPKKLLADLEHQAISDILTNYAAIGPESLEGWISQCWWLTALPQQAAPFRKGQASKILYLLPEDDYDEFVFKEKDNKGSYQPVELGNSITWDQQQIPKSHQWLERDYGLLLRSIAEKRNDTLSNVAKKYGEISIPENENNRFCYSNDFGMIRSRNE